MVVLHSPFPGDGGGFTHSPAATGEGVGHLHSRVDTAERAFERDISELASSREQVTKVDHMRSYL